MDCKIFISFKNSFQGEPTKDRAMAEELYRFLSENGYKGEVFFSEREIYKEGSSDYARIISDALQRAKVLIYVCADARHFDSSFPETQYVNYEWKSFNNEIKSGRKQGGGIFGILGGVKINDLPYDLRQHQAYAYKTEFSKLLCTLDVIFDKKSAFDESEEPDKQLKKFINSQLVKFGYLQEDISVRTQFSDYLKLQINERTKISMVYYQPASGYSSALFSAIKNLDAADINILYLKDFDDFSLIEPLISSRLKEKYFIVIDKITDLQEGKKVTALAESYDNICVLISVAYDCTDVYETFKRRAVVYKFGTFSGAETREFLNGVSGELDISITGNLLTTLLLPSLRELRTPVILRGILVELSHLPDYKEKNYTICDILRSIDAIIAREGENCLCCIEHLITLAMNKKINKFSYLDISEYKQEVEKLIKLGVLRRLGNGYSFISDDYFYYKIAGMYFETNGVIAQAEWFEFIPDSVPYYIYMYYEETGKYIGGKFEIASGKVYQLLQLFVNNGEIIGGFIKNRQYTDEILNLVKFFRKSGLYVTGKYLIGLFKENGVESSDSFDYASEEMMIFFQETGKLLDTEQTHGDIYYRKGYISYCIDDIDSADEYFDLAYKKMLEDGEFSEGMLFDYTEYLIDVGDYERLKEVTALLERHLQPDSPDYMMRYSFLKGSIAINNLEFSLAKDFFKDSIEYCNQDIKLKRLQIYYGNLGEVYFYLNDLTAAKKYYETNLYIARLINDSNGLCISSKLLGKIELFCGNYLRAFKYFGQSKIYAEKADNKWRLGKVLLYMNLLCKGKFGEMKYIELTGSNIYQIDFYFLRSLICYVCGDLNGTELWLEKAVELIPVVNCKYICEKTQAFRRYLSGGGLSATHKDMLGYCETLFKTVEELKSADINIDTDIMHYLYKELDTGRLYLRHISLDDAQSIYEYSSDIFNTKYIMWNVHGSVSDAYDYIDSMFDIDKAGKTFTWAVQEKESAAMIGTIDLVYNESYGVYEVGYILNKRFWGKGYATEALNAVIGFAKDVLKLDKIAGAVFSVNEKSRQVLEKCGFEFVKIIENYHSRPDVLDKSGAYYELKLK